MNVVQKMEALADEWHCGVERKGKGHVPYIAHPRAVVAQLKAWGMTEEANPVPLAVAWGHEPRGGYARSGHFHFECRRRAWNQGVRGHPLSHVQPSRVSIRQRPR